MTDSTAVPGPAYLIHTFEHRAYPLPEDRAFSIGRETAGDIAVNEVAVSRHHAEIRREGGDFVLYPTGSTVTVMDELPVTEPRTLREGDTFNIGTMKFVFTRERLPVAMGIARPTNRPSTVDDRRPTLTFPSQPAVPEIKQPKSGPRLSLLILLVLAVLGYLVYWFLSSR